MEIANFAGLSHAGAPVITRGSTRTPASAANNVSSIATPTSVSGRLNAQAWRRRARGFGMLNLFGSGNAGVFTNLLLSTPESTKPRYQTPSSTPPRATRAEGDQGQRRQTEGQPPQRT